MMDQAQSLREMVQEKRQDVVDKIENDKNIEIYTITSGKGGVGKTNFTVNLAIELQSRGKQVLVIDADLGMANVDVLLGIFPKVTLFDVFFNGKPLKDAIVEGPGGIKIIPGGSGIMKMTELTEEQHKKLAYDFMELSDVDVILLDTGAGISKNLMSLITFSKETIIVTTPEPTSMTDAYGVIKTVSEIGIKKSMKVVINKASSKDVANYTFERLKDTVHNFLDIRLESIGYILDDVRVSNAVMARKPFLHEYPNSMASKCISQVADNLEKDYKPEAGKKKLSSFSEVYNRLIKVFG